ncbi:MAG: aKG-HExxH-type peptide beta-hydroxylase [Bdellovibrionia bacterium]
MYFSLGLKENLQNVAVLSYRFLRNQTEITPFSLKSAYCNFLNIIQPEVPFNKNNTLNVLNDQIIEKEVIALYRQESGLDDKNQISVISTEDDPKRLKKKRHLEEFISKKYFDPKFFELMNLVINYIFFGVSSVARGGTASGAIGTIWLTDPTNYSDHDLMELLVHETTHNLMFLDEKRYKHYKDYSYVIQKEYYARSAILKEARPLDKVVHSLAVATEILIFREKHTGHHLEFKAHPASSSLLKAIYNSINSIKSDQKLCAILAPRSIHLINHFESTAQRLESSILSVA